MADLDYAAQLEAAYQQQQVSRAANAQRQAEEAQRQQAAAEAAAAEAERTRSRTWGEVAGDTAAAALQSAVGLGGAAYGLANVATVGTLDRVTGMSENFQQTQDIIEGWKSNPLQARKQAMQAAFKDEGVGAGLAYAVQNPSLIADLGVQSSAYLIPGIAAARVAGKAAAATTAARLAATGSKASDAVKAATIAAQAGKEATKANLISQAAMTGGYMNVDSVNAARGAGATPGEQQALGLAGAAAGALFNTAVTKLTGAGALEVAVASRFGGAAVPGAAGGLVRGVATGAAREGTEETLQEGGEQVIRNAAGAKELGTGVATNMALGGLLGVTLGGVMGAANPRRPSQTRAEAAQMQRQVETEIAKMNGTTNAPTVLSPSPLANILTQRENAQYDYAGNPVDLAGGQLGEQGATLNYGETQQVEPTVQQEVSPDQYSMFDEAGQPTREEINLDEAGLPLADQLPQVEELTGARAVIAERNARRASQPPRMDVVEQPVEEVTIDALPQVVVDAGPRSLNDVYRETAPIGGVAQRFGIQAAAAEASRRAGAAPAATVEPATLTPIDVSTPKAAKQFGGSVRQALAAATGVDAKFITGADFKELTTQLAASGVTPSSPDFAKKVGLAAAKLAGKREAAGKPANFLGAVVDKYPVTMDDRVDAAFDTAGAPTTEEELFGEAPAASVQPSAAPAQAGLKVQPNPETLLSFLSKRGGVALDEQMDTLGDTGKRANKGYKEGNLFRSGGDGIDSVAIAMHESGYLTDAEFYNPRDNGGVNAARAKIAESFGGAKVYAEGSDAQAKQFEQALEVRIADEEARAADQAAVSPDITGPAYDAYEQMPAALVIDAITAGRAEVASLNPTFDGMIGALDAAQTVADASAAAFAARQHPTYIQMSPEDTLAFEHHLAEVMASLNGIKFDLGPVVNGAGKPAVSDVIFRGLTAAASRQTGIPTVAHVDVANAEYVVGYAIPANARGFYDPATGTIHIIQANNADKAELAFTLAHEAGHAGLDKLLGANLQSAMNRMWANAPMRERIKAHMAHMAQNPGMTRQLAAEEVLADMLAGGEKINTDVMTKLRNGVRNFFARLVGIRDLVVTNEEVDRLLADVALVINGEQPVNVKVGGQDAALWLNNPSSIAAQNPKFSLAQADYESMVAAAKNEPASNVLPLSHIAKALGQASVDSAKQAGNALTENKMGRAYVRNFMHLDHLVSWYDKKFNPTGAKTGGFLRKVADLKQGREAQFNRLNAKQKDLVYKTVVNGNEVLRPVGKKSVNDVNESWDKFKRTNPDKARALDFALTEGTFYQVFPDRSWEDQVTKDFDYEGKGYTEVERLVAYERASNAYKAAGTEGQTLYMQSQAVYAQRFNEHYAAIKQEAERLGARAKADAEKNGVDVELVAARVDNATARYKDAIGRVMGKVQQGPYSPLQRYGEYVATVRNDKGEVVHFSAYDTKSAADAAAAEILEARTAAGEKVNVNVSAAKDAEFDSTGVARGEIESIRNEVMGMLPAGLDPDVREKAMAAITAGLTEAYLQSLPAKSFAKHALGRKNVAGYDTDALRAFANYTMRSARAVAGVEYDGRIANSLMDVQTFVDDTAKGKYTDKMGVVDTAQLQNIADSVKRQHKESLRSDSNKIVDSLTGASFIYMMTSPSHMLFNATQTAMVAFPRLAGVYGAGKASKEIRKALGEYFRSGTDMMSERSVLSKSAQTNPADALLLESLTAIKENGPLDLTQAHDAAGIADGSSSDLSPYWGKTMKWASYAMHKSEVFNRQITATAAIRLELEKALAGGVPPADPAARAALVADLVRAGEDAIRTTQFDYSKANKPPILQGPMGKLLGQFQQYRFHMLSMIGKDIRDAELGKLVTMKEPINKEEAAIARSTLAWTLGMQLAFTGTAGTIIAPFAFALADLWRDDDDLTTSAQAWNNMVGSCAAHGVFAWLIDTSRISASTLIPVLGQTAYAPIDGKPGATFTYYVTQNLGPSFGLVKNLTGGTSDLINGDVAKAVGKLLPKPIADVHKAAYEGANGARDARQIMYFEPGPFDTLMTLAGLKSGERRDIEARRGALYTANANRFAIKDRNLGRLALAYSTGDADAIAEAMQGINDWNAQYPDMAVRGSEMRSAVVSRIRTERTAADTGFSSTRAPTPSLVEKIGQ